MANTLSAKLDPNRVRHNSANDVYDIFTASTAPIPGCMIGVGVYYRVEFGNEGVHEDNEGFYVLEGSGEVKLDDEIYPLEPGTAFFAPAGVRHTIRKFPDSVDLKVLLYHFPK